MDDLIRTPKIDPRALQEDNYFLSLLGEATRTGLLSENEVERVQIEAVGRLSASLRSYTGGESSSVRTELAEGVMSSILYTVGLALRDAATPEDAVEMLRTRSIDDLFFKGQERLKAKLFTVRKLGDFLKTHHKKTRAVYYKQAVTRVAFHFLRRYNPRFFADDAVVLPDYPLFSPVFSAVGVEFMQKYMEALYLETRFLSHFEDQKTEYLFRKETPDYAVTPLNLTSPVLLSALTATLLSRSPKELFLGYSEKEVAALFTGLSETQIEEKLLGALPRLLSSLGEENKSLALYLRRGLPALSALVFAACEKESIAYAYPVFKRASEEKHLFRFGRRMDDDLYSGVVYMTENAEGFEEKAAIIREKIHSLYDLEDILRDLLFEKKEMKSLLRPLTESELAFLLKKHPEPDASEKRYMPEGDLRLSEALSELLSERTEGFRDTVRDLSLLISDDIFEL